MKVRQIMTAEPVRMHEGATVSEAARAMRDANIGALLVERDGQVSGIVTDRDLVVRALADGPAGANRRLKDVCTASVLSVGPDDDTDAVIALMRQQKIRRVPVLDGGRDAIGILSLGDLAIQRDAESVLGQISAAPPTH